MKPQKDSAFFNGLARSAIAAGKIDIAYSAFASAAKEGDAEAAFELYRLDKITGQKSKQSLMWLLKAADKKYAPAFHYLGLESYEDDGLSPRDNELAAVYFLKAAKNGYAPSFEVLARIHAHSHIANTTLSQAFYWAQKSLVAKQKDMASLPPISVASASLLTAIKNETRLLNEICESSGILPSATNANGFDLWFRDQSRFPLNPGKFVLPKPAPR
jgi:hypothetical protein